MAYTNKEKIKFERCLFKIAEPELKKFMVISIFLKIKQILNTAIILNNIVEELALKL